MITVHPFEASRETIQGMWSGPAHARRQAPDASLKELFVHLHWMLLTKVQLDDFRPMLARFEEKLLIEGASSSRCLLRGGARSTAPIRVRRTLTCFFRCFIAFVSYYR